jgi:riboflavin synthase
MTLNIDHYELMTLNIVLLIFLMFTGIVEELGTVIMFQNGQLTIECSLVLQDVHLGDSIAVSGVCLTVVEFQQNWFKVELAPETLRKTNLGNLSIGHLVNLERAMSATTRFGGHIVQGHVDVAAQIVSIVPDPPNSMIFTLKVPATHLMPLIVPKGYVCLDGASLTVIDVDYQNFSFTVMLIPYTQERVIMTKKAPGDLVNLEVDQMGKLLEQQITAMLQSGRFDSLIEKLVSKTINLLDNK